MWKTKFFDKLGVNGHAAGLEQGPAGQTGTRNLDLDKKTMRNHDIPEKFRAGVTSFQGTQENTEFAHVLEGHSIRKFRLPCKGRDLKEGPLYGRLEEFLDDPGELRNPWKTASPLECMFRRSCTLELVTPTILSLTSRRKQNTGYMRLHAYIAALPQDGSNRRLSKCDSAVASAASKRGSAFLLRRGKIFLMFSGAEIRFSRAIWFNCRKRLLRKLRKSYRMQNPKTFLRRILLLSSLGEFAKKLLCAHPKIVHIKLVLGV